MSKKNTGRTEAEMWELILLRYKKANPGAFRSEDVVEWALQEGLADLPRVDPKAILKRKLKSAMRRMRMVDPQGRKVRKMLPAKIATAIDENGTELFDIVWDHIHEMSLDHALLSFDQRDENIQKQKRSATRDLDSSLDNNPNLEGCREQFEFGFMVEEVAEQIVEVISETPVTNAPNQPR